MVLWLQYTTLLFLYYLGRFVKTKLPRDSTKYTGSSIPHFVQPHFSRGKYWKIHNPGTLGKKKNAFVIQGGTQRRIIWHETPPVIASYTE
jgi:hypothetical protein